MELVCQNFDVRQQQLKCNCNNYREWKGEDPLSHLSLPHKSPALHLSLFPFSLCVSLLII